MVSTFREVLLFFDKIGIYDVVLPFLLTFTIVFAIFDKTKVLGSEKIGDKDYPKKNLNAMVAFCISFLVIASAELVEIIAEVSANMVILLLLSVFFLLLVGSFYKEGEGVYLKDGWNKLFMGIMFIGIVAIFLHAIKKDNQPFLEWLINYMFHELNSTIAGSILLLIIMIFFVYFIVVGFPKGEEKKSKG